MVHFNCLLDNGCVHWSINEQRKASVYVVNDILFHKAANGNCGRSAGPCAHDGNISCARCSATEQTDKQECGKCAWGGQI